MAARIRKSRKQFHRPPPPPPDQPVVGQLQPWRVSKTFPYAALPFKVRTTRSRLPPAEQPEPGELQPWRLARIFPYALPLQVETGRSRLPPEEALESKPLPSSRHRQAALNEKVLVPGPSGAKRISRFGLPLPGIQEINLLSRFARGNSDARFVFGQVRRSFIFDRIALPAHRDARGNDDARFVFGGTRRVFLFARPTQLKRRYSPWQWPIPPVRITRSKPVNTGGPWGKRQVHPVQHEEPHSALYMLTRGRKQPIPPVIGPALRIYRKPKPEELFYYPSMVYPRGKAPLGGELFDSPVIPRIRLIDQWLAHRDTPPQGSAIRRRLPGVQLLKFMLRRVASAAFWTFTWWRGRRGKPSEIHDTILRLRQIRAEFRLPPMPRQIRWLRHLVGPRAFRRPLYRPPMLLWLQKPIRRRKATVFDYAALRRRQPPAPSILVPARVVKSKAKSLVDDGFIPSRAVLANIWLAHMEGAVRRRIGKPEAETAEPVIFRQRRPFEAGRYLALLDRYYYRFRGRTLREQKTGALLATVVLMPAVHCAIYLDVNSRIYSKDDPV